MICSHYQHEAEEETLTIPGGPSSSEIRNSTFHNAPYRQPNMVCITSDRPFVQVNWTRCITLADENAHQACLSRLGLTMTRVCGHLGDGGARIYETQKPLPQLANSDQNNTRGKKNSNQGPMQLFACASSELQHDRSLLPFIGSAIAAALSIASFATAIGIAFASSIAVALVGTLTMGLGIAAGVLLLTAFVLLTIACVTKCKADQNTNRDTKQTSRDTKQTSRYKANLEIQSKPRNTLTCNKPYPKGGGESKPDF